MPLISLIILSIFHPIFKILILVSLALFYFYCFLLRLEVNDWVEEERARNQLMLERMEEEKNKF